jgi:large subunit ribosomal protein L9
MIEVILLEKIGRLGTIGQKVKVRPGYARNYLLPRSKALRATKENLARFEVERVQIEARNADAKAKAEAVSKTLEGRKFVIIRQASELGQLFGSVNVRDVALQLHEAGFEVERQNVALSVPIKMLGLHKVEVHLHPEVSVSVTMNIARTEDEAAVQEKTGAAVKKAQQDKEDAEATAAADAAALFDAPPAEAAEGDVKAEASEEAAAEAKPAKKPRAKKEAAAKEE